MSAARPAARALAFGLAGGCLAAAVMTVPALVADAPSGRITDYFGMAVGLLVIHVGTRASAPAGASLAARLANAAILVTTLCAMAGLALYGLFAEWRPGLLAARLARYEGEVRASGAAPERVAKELARLAAAQGPYLDAAYQALSVAGNLFIVGMLLGAYGGWRSEVARRWQRRVAPGAG